MNFTGITYILIVIYLNRVKLTRCAWYLRRRLRGVISQFHFITLDLIETLLTVDVSVGQKAGTT